MNGKISIPAHVSLEYWTESGLSGGTDQGMPVDPDHTNELVIAVRSDDGDGDPRASVLAGTPQIHLAGTSRALEALGRYLIALARLQSHDPDLHEHFEDVQNDDGGTVHLIVRRLKDEP